MQASSDSVLESATNTIVQATYFQILKNKIIEIFTNKFNLYIILFLFIAHLIGKAYFNFDVFKSIYNKLTKSKPIPKKEDSEIDDALLTNNELDSESISESSLDTSSYGKVIDAIKKSKRTRLHMNIMIHGHYAGELIIELFDDIVPKTVRNFVKLAEAGKYNDTKFHRIVPGMCIQGGDFVRGDGSGSYSIYGESFPDENFNIKHDKPGLLSMANSGPNTNGCQFFITFGPQPHLDNKHVVFGQIIGGGKVLERMADVPKGMGEQPSVEVKISYLGPQLTQQSSKKN